MEDLKGGVPIGRTQLRGVLAVLQWWGFNVLVIIMNKWIFQVSAHINFMMFFDAECLWSCKEDEPYLGAFLLFATSMLNHSVDEYSVAEEGSINLNYFCIISNIYELSKSIDSER